MDMDHTEVSVDQMEKENPGIVGLLRKKDNEIASEIIAKENGEAAKRNYTTRAELMEKIDGLQMNAESLIVMIDALRKQNKKLSVLAQKATIKADAYKEMIHEILVTNVKDHTEEFGDVGTDAQ